MMFCSLTSPNHTPIKYWGLIKKSYQLTRACLKLASWKVNFASMCAWVKFGVLPLNKLGQIDTCLVIGNVMWRKISRLTFKVLNRTYYMDDIHKLLKLHVHIYTTLETNLC